MLQKTTPNPAGRGKCVLYVKGLGEKTGVHKKAL